MSVIEIKNLNITYKEKTLLNNINLSIKSGKITALIGKSGSGKTLTATALNGFLASNLSLNFDLFLDHKKISFLSKGFLQILCKIQLLRLIHSTLWAIQQKKV